MLVDVTTEAAESDWEALVRADRDCRVYWGGHGCEFERGHAGRQHRCHGDACPQPEMGYMYGEDTTSAERAELD